MEAGKPPDSVMVAVRCRPFNTREKNQGEASIITIGEEGLVAIEQPEEGAPSRQFSFDHTYDESSVQPQVRAQSKSLAPGLSTHALHA